MTVASVPVASLLSALALTAALSTPAQAGPIAPPRSHGPDLQLGVDVFASHRARQHSSRSARAF